MNLGILARNVCKICGSETMGADIGCSCRKLYGKATFIALRNYNNLSLAYNYGIEMHVIMDNFVKFFDEKAKKHNNEIEKMFRSDFRKNFFTSVYEFYKSKNFVSKKQLDIVKKSFEYESEKLYADIEEKQKSFLLDFQKNHDKEIVEITKNLWKQKNKK